MKQILASTVATLLWVPGLTWAQGVLEVPAVGSIQSGIGVLSGWQCTAGMITLRFD